MKHLCDVADAIVNRVMNMQNISVIVKDENELKTFLSGYKSALYDILHDVIDIAYANGREDS